MHLHVQCHVCSWRNSKKTHPSWTTTTALGSSDSGVCTAEFAGTELSAACALYTLHCSSSNGTSSPRCSSSIFSTCAWSASNTTQSIFHRMRQLRKVAWPEEVLHRQTLLLTQHAVRPLEFLLPADNQIVVLLDHARKSRLVAHVNGLLFS